MSQICISSDSRRFCCIQQQKRCLTAFWNTKADVAHPDGLGQAVLHDGHLLCGALGAQEAAAVATVVATRGQSELGHALLATVSFSPPGFFCSDYWICSHKNPGGEKETVARSAWPSSDWPRVATTVATAAASCAPSAPQRRCPSWSTAWPSPSGCATSALVFQKAVKHLSCCWMQQNRRESDEIQIWLFWRVLTKTQQKDLQSNSDRNGIEYFWQKNHE
jgi:hypothetical protein